MIRPDSLTQERVIDAVSGMLMVVASVPAQERSKLLVAANQALKTSVSLILGPHYQPFVSVLVTLCPGFHQNAFGPNLTLENVQASLALAFPPVATATA